MKKHFFDIIETRLLPVAVWPATLALFVMMMVTVIDVISRTVFNQPIKGSVEITELSLGIMIVCIFPLVVWRESHISVDLLDHIFPSSLVMLRKLLINLCAAIALGFLSWQLYKYTDRAFRYGDVTEFLRIPKGYVYAVMTIMGAFSALISALLAFKQGIVIFKPNIFDETVKPLGRNHD